MRGLSGASRFRGMNKRESQIDFPLLPRFLELQSFYGRAIDLSGHW
jgi:hypothetical protein